MKHFMSNGFNHSNLFKTKVTQLGQVCLSLAFCLTMTACNQDEYYEKEYLENRPQAPTTGSVNGGGQAGSNTGSTQGGVNGGVQGGTDGSATAGSSTGGDTSGSTTGSTAGGNTSGTTTGGVDGSATGGTTAGSTTGSSTAGSTTGSSTAGSTTGSSTAGSTTGGGSTGGTTYTCNNGHGNNADGIDSSNPGNGNGGPNGQTDGSVDDENHPCRVSETFKQAASHTKKLDIIWVVDNSKSMEDEQAALGSNFDAFINNFIDMDVDFKMGITTTDVTNGNKGVMVKGSEKLTSVYAKNNESRFKSDFKRLVQVGVSGSGDEKGLEASEGFMQNYAKTFIREDAYLMVVILSDEEDQSPKKALDYADYLKGFKKEAGLVKLYAIVDTKPDPNRATRGLTQGYIRYQTAAKATAGQVSDINQDFWKTLGSMGETIIRLLDSFALANDVYADTLKVRVNGQVATAYTFDAATRSIKFHDGALPPVGAEIKVTYLKK